MHRVIESWRAALDETASHWLGLTCPPVERAIAQAGFSADDPDAYCGRCGSTIGPHEATDDGCGSCRGERIAIDGIIRLGPYDGPMPEWIPRIKYNGWVEMGEALAVRLARAIADSSRVNLECAIIVPMPMSWQRRLYRGQDHAGTIARAVARELRVPLVRALTKSNAAPQVSLNRAERIRSGPGLYHLRKWRTARRIDDRIVILIDDVKTTGASLNAAARALRKARIGHRPAPPAKVLAAVLAVADDASRRSRQDRGGGGDSVRPPPP